jgi:hypothetical protein
MNRQCEAHQTPIILAVKSRSVRSLHSSQLAVRNGRDNLASSQGPMIEPEACDHLLSGQIHSLRQPPGTDDMAVALSWLIHSVADFLCPPAKRPAYQSAER